MTGGTAAAQGIAMLNPQRWVGNGGATTGYSRNIEKDNETLFENGEEDDFVEDEKPKSLALVGCARWFFFWVHTL